MRKLLLPTVLLSAVVLLGCPLLKKKGDDAEAEADADVVAEVDATAPAAEVEEDAAPPPPSEPVVVDAKNVADVARFPGETLVTDDDAKLAQSASARTAPKTGKIIATLKPASDVNKVAEYQDSYLVTFTDPKDSSATLLGWIGKESFTVPTKVLRATDAGATTTDAGAAKVDAGPPKADAGAPKADAGAPTITCAAGQVAVVLSKDPICKKKCTKDADCKSGGCANANRHGGGVVRVCATE